MAITRSVTAPFTFSISDDGDGTLTFSATASGHTASGTATVPAAFVGAPVWFQAGDYQHAGSMGGGAPDDGARVRFHALGVGP